MIPESQADKLLAPIYNAYDDVETTILAHAGDIQLTLLCSKSDLKTAEQRVDELAARMEEALEDWLYSSGAESADSLEQIVLYYLGLRQSTLAVAESCTGGMIAQRITSVPGSSRSFLGLWHPPLHRRYAGPGRNRHRRPHRRHGTKTGRPGLHRPQRCKEHRVHRENLPRRPRPHQTMDHPASPRPCPA